MTYQQLIEERKRILDARSSIEGRKALARTRLVEIEDSYPRLLVSVAEGDRDEQELDSMAAEVIKLRGVIAEPTEQACRLLDDKIKKVNGRIQRVRAMQAERDADLKFRLFFNQLLGKRILIVGDEEQLKALAVSTRHKEAAAKLLAQLADYRFKRSFPVPAKFEDIVTIQPFPEEPDDSLIEG